MCLPGFAGQFRRSLPGFYVWTATWITLAFCIAAGNNVSIGAQNLYYLGWLTTTSIGFIGYIVLCRIWPNPIWPAFAADKPAKWESLRETDGYFPEEVIACATEKGDLEDVSKEDNEEKVSGSHEAVAA